jgi:hypothetical protein
MPDPPVVSFPAACTHHTTAQPDLVTKHPGLLPGDAYLAHLLGWSEDQLLRYQLERQQAAAREWEQNPPIARCDPGTLSVISLVTSVLSVGYTILSALLAPRPRQPGQVSSSQRQGDNITDGARYSPRPGFDSSQEVARLGSVIPITFARREFLPALNGRPAGWYGGCRVDLGLVWSQLVPVDGSQLFRGVYVLGEGPMAEIDPDGFAIGNNPLRSYDLGNAGANEAAARMTIYARLTGGRIRSSDRIAGRLAINDIGNMENAGGGDVFQVRSTGGVIRPDACAAARPSSSTACGLFATLGNGLGLRVNPQLRPTRQMNLKPIGSTGNQLIDPVDDPVALGAIWKARRMWSGRSGIVMTSTGVTSGEAFLNVGDTFDYFLSNSSDALTKLVFLPLINTDCELGVGHRESCSDVAATISGRQRSADDALKVGELFKAGSCLAVLEQRIPSDRLFISDADNQPVGGGQTVTARFRVVRAGRVYVTSSGEINPAGTGTEQFPPPVNIFTFWEWTLVDPGPRYATGTNRPHLHRCAIADFTLTKPAQILEIGIRSTLGIGGSGFTNLRQAPTLTLINLLAGGHLDGFVLAANQKLQFSTFQSGARNFSEERYSFVRISYRAENSTTFVELPTIYGVRGLTQQAQTNGLQLELPADARCAQVRLEPLSGWEIRSGAASGLLAVLDSRMSTWQTVVDGACIVRYLGEAPFVRSQDRFGLNSIEPDGKIDLGLGYSDGNALTDLWGKLAETFVYDEIQTTAGQAPEHEIAFVNLVESNASTPTYSGIAGVGMNIRAALEFQSVNQLSAQVVGGHIAPRYIEASNGPTHLLPDIFARLALSPEFGAGQDVKAEQINAPSFLESAQWCFSRRYFFDGTLPQPQNLRQWAADQAGLHLLAFYELNGQFYFKPALTFDPVRIVDLFTAANIKKGTFQSTTSDDDQRLPIQVSGLYREERSNDDLLTPGVFSTVREITIREATASDSDPVEPLDLQLSCTNRWHLIDAAKYLIRWRRLVGDPISFETTYAGVLRPIAPEDHIAVAYDEALNDLYSNGAVLDDGTLVASEPLQDGSYEVLAWDGTTPPGPTLQTLVVSSGGRKGNLLGSVWTRTAPPQLRTYRVMRVAPTDDGRLRIDAVLMPTDETGRLLLCQDWDEPSAWVIRG